MKFLSSLLDVGVPGFEPGTLPISNRDALPGFSKKKGEQKLLSTLHCVGGTLPISNRDALPGHYKKRRAEIAFYSPLCRGTRIRTWDPLVPNQVRYRTALHPDDFCRFD